jgi:NADPH:quinone reductase-like Zn-dependent oxidoreductase
VEQTHLVGRLRRATLAQRRLEIYGRGGDTPATPSEKEALVKAMLYTTYGSPDVLKLKEVGTPTLGEQDVLIRVHAAAANAGDLHLLSGDPLMIRLVAGLLKPKHQILGADVAGQVTAVGRAVTQFRPGDAVFGDLSASGYGAFAEYVAAPAHTVALKPAGLTFEEAAAVPSAALTALQGLRDAARLQPGQRVLVNGASGNVGTFAVQIAKALGAEVTAVCSTRNLDRVRSLGADHAIDYTQEDFTRRGQQYDIILDAAASHSLADVQRALTPRGAYILVGGSGDRFLQVMLLGPWYSKKGGQRFGTFVKKPTQEKLAFVKELLETGRIAPVVDRSYPLHEAAEALRYLKAGHTTGKVVITLSQGERT